MEQEVVGGIGSTRPMTWLLGLFSLVAVLVAIVGIYGVLSYTMAQRTQEIGIRMALGADGAHVRAMVVREGARIIGIAIPIGLVVSLAATRLIRSQLYGVGPNDVLTFAAMTAVLSGIALAACCVPAWRASRVDPMTALRAE
jgi:ABC-type antimicrobial peptide transport system permease subunit